MDSGMLGRKLMKPETAIAIIFGDGFGDDDFAMHEDIIRTGAPEVDVRSFKIEHQDDITLAQAWTSQYKYFTVWNCYWSVNDISAALDKIFCGKIVGSNQKITSRTSLKSTMYATIQDAGLPCPWYAYIRGLNELGFIENIPYPVVVKADAGYDSIDMSETSVCLTLDELRNEVDRLIKKHDGLIIQRFLDGREFTIACGNQNVFRPVEKIPEDGQRIYLSWLGNRKQYCGDAALEDRVRTLGKQIIKAFGFGVADYCRIDIREDASTGDLFPIDVNDMCSLYPGGQFEYSLAGDGLSRDVIAHWLTSPAVLPQDIEGAGTSFAFCPDLGDAENSPVL